MNISLVDQTALVTGGARGIGRECSLLLAEAGARVVVTYNKSKEKAETLDAELAQRGIKADFFQADISKPDEVDRLFEFVHAQRGRLDILVNNAGIQKDNLLLNVELSEWERVYEVNLRGAFLCTKAATELMFPQHRGNIVNIASTLAIVGTRGTATYAASKGGLMAFTRTCAVELGKKGIRVNAIAPGVIDTVMTSRLLKRQGEALLNRIALNRFGKPEDVANLVVFLCSDKADYLTGQTIVLDGGLTIT